MWRGIPGKGTDGLDPVLCELGSQSSLSRSYCETSTNGATVAWLGSGSSVENTSSAFVFARR